MTHQYSTTVGVISGMQSQQTSIQHLHRWCCCLLDPFQSIFVSCSGESCVATFRAISHGVGDPWIWLENYHIWILIIDLFTSKQKQKDISVASIDSIVLDAQFMDELSFFGSIGNPDPITDDLVDTVSPPELSPVESIDDDETLLLSMGMVQAWVAKKLVNVTFKTDRIETHSSRFGGKVLTDEKLHDFLMCRNCIQPIVGTSSPHLCTCSIVAFEKGYWGGKTTLGVYPKSILPRVSPSQLIFVPSQLVFVVLFS